MIILIAKLSVSISSRRRCINKRNIFFRTIGPYLFRIFHVPFFMDGIIELGCVRPCAEVNDEIYFEGFMIYPFNKPVTFNKIGEPFTVIVRFLSRVGKIINDNDILIASAIEIAYHVAANEPRSSGNNDLCILIHEGKLRLCRNQIAASAEPASSLDK